MKLLSKRNVTEKGCEKFFVLIYKENNMYYAHYKYTDTRTENVKEYKSLLFKNPDKWLVIKQLISEANLSLKKQNIYKPEEFTDNIWKDYFNFYQPMLEEVR